MIHRSRGGRERVRALCNVKMDVREYRYVRGERDKRWVWRCGKNGRKRPPESVGEPALLLIESKAGDLLDTDREKIIEDRVSSRSRADETAASEGKRRDDSREGEFFDEDLEALVRRKVDSGREDK